MRGMVGRTFGEAAELACLIESYVKKPGNVYPGGDLDELKYEYFVKAARAIRTPVRKVAERGFRAAKDDLELDEIGIGKYMLEAAERSWKIGRVNINLGVIMLFMPLSAALGYSYGSGENIVRSAKVVISAGTVEDSVNLFKAVRRMRPSLKKPKGEMSRYDVFNRESEKWLRKEGIMLPTLLRMCEGDEIMDELRDGFPMTRWASRNITRRMRDGSWEDAIQHTYIRILQMKNDSHVEKTHDRKTASWVRMRAMKFKGMRVGSRRWRRSIEEFDRLLRKKKINPGSSADIIAAGIFLHLLSF